MGGQWRWYFGNCLFFLFAGLLWIERGIWRGIRQDIWNSIDHRLHLGVNASTAARLC
jgi:hypothetical protein